ncbi:MAG: hypothetical protein J6U23_10630 [Clostridiales bacterium]|nr:hypothetical protein [Clostridiales bacterium]
MIVNSGKVACKATNRRYFKVLVSVILMCTVLMCSCNRDVPDDKVTPDNLNNSAQNVCRGFFQSIYEDDMELFKKCFNDHYFDGNEEEVFKGYKDSSVSGMTFVGTKHIATRPCDENNDLNYDTVKGNIAFFHNIAEDEIKDIQLVSVKLFFEDQGTPKTIEVYSIIYLAEQSWYFFSVVDVTAKNAK